MATELDPIPWLQFCQALIVVFFSCPWDYIDMAVKRQAKGVLQALTQPGIGQVEAVVIAVSDLGGASRSVDTEDVAMRCKESAPGLFAWRKYPDQVNLELVRVCLSNAKKPQSGVLLSGSGREGWRLTRNGLEWISQHKQRGNQPFRPGRVSRRTAGSIDTVRRERERVRIEGSLAWAAWRRGSQIDMPDAQEIFRVDGYASSQLVEIKVTRLLNLFEPGTELRHFLDAAATALTDKRKR